MRKAIPTYLDCNLATKCLSLAKGKSFTGEAWDIPSYSNVRVTGKVEAMHTKDLGDVLTKGPRPGPTGGNWRPAGGMSTRERPTGFKSVKAIEHRERKKSKGT